MNTIRCAVALGLLLMLVGCATTQTNTAMDTGETIDAALKPKGIHEECFPMKPAEEVRVNFDASKPVDFNIHYHMGDKIFYPVEQKGIAKWQGTFRAEKDDVYCLMWTNTATEPVWLKGSYGAVRKPVK
jgi:hypothetical protein